jgi:hypothetical protein
MQLISSQKEPGQLPTPEQPQGYGRNSTDPKVSCYKFLKRGKTPQKRRFFLFAYLELLINVVVWERQYFFQSIT